MMQCNGLILAWRPEIFVEIWLCPRTVYVYTRDKTVIYIEFIILMRVCECMPAQTVWLTQKPDSSNIPDAHTRVQFAFNKEPIAADSIMNWTEKYVKPDNLWIQTYTVEKIELV